MKHVIAAVEQTAVAARGCSVALVGLIFACSLSVLASAASAQTTLVSNTGQSSTNTSGNEIGAILGPEDTRAQQFSTGSNPTGHTLSSVDFFIRSFSSGDSVAVAIYSSDSNGNPGSEVYALTNPTTVSDGLNTFTAPADSALAAQTKYFVHIRAPAGDYTASLTYSHAEDPESATGWSIKNTSQFTEDHGVNWGSSLGVVRTAISGTVRPAALVLNLDEIAGDNRVNIAEKAAGFAISGDTGTESGVSVTVKVGSTTLNATSADDGTWSVSVPAAATYIAGTSVAVRRAVEHLEERRTVFSATGACCRQTTPSRLRPTSAHQNPSGFSGSMRPTSALQPRRQSFAPPFG